MLPEAPKSCLKDLHLNRAVWSNSAELSCWRKVIENTGCGMECPWAVFLPSALLCCLQSAEGSLQILSQVCTGLSVKHGVIPCGARLETSCLYWLWQLLLQRAQSSRIILSSGPRFPPPCKLPMSGRRMTWWVGLCVNTSIWTCLGASPHGLVLVKHTCGQAAYEGRHALSPQLPALQHVPVQSQKLEIRC